MAGEPESLSIHEPLDQRVDRHDFDRLIMLSDGVFAIAITLLALELKIPDRWNGQLSTLFADAARGLTGYAFAFLLVGAFWVAHRRMFAKIVKVDSLVTILNVVALGLIGLAPFVARLIAERGPERAIPVYLLLTGAIFTIYAAIHAAAGFRGLIHPEFSRERWRLETLGLAVSGLITLGGGAAYAFEGGRVSPINLIVLVLVASIAGRLFRHRAKRVKARA